MIVTHYSSGGPVNIFLPQLYLQGTYLLHYMLCVCTNVRCWIISWFWYYHVCNAVILNRVWVWILLIRRVVAESGGGWGRLVSCHHNCLSLHIMEGTWRAISGHSCVSSYRLSRALSLADLAPLSKHYAYLPMQYLNNSKIGPSDDIV